MAKRRKRRIVPAPVIKPRLPPVWARKRIAELEKAQLEKAAQTAQTTMSLADFGLKDFPGIERDLEAYFAPLNRRIESLADRIKKLEAAKRKQTDHSSPGMPPWNSYAWMLD